MTGPLLRERFVRQRDRAGGHSLSDDIWAVVADNARYGVDRDMRIRNRA
jgi:hypothetical protein